MWCKRPGDGDYLADDRSCFERFFCACPIWLIGLVTCCLIVLILFYRWFNFLLFMTPTKILRIIIIVAFLGLSVLAIQLTSGVSDSDPSSELQEAMPALQQWVLERYLLMTWKKLFFARIECDCVSYILLVVYNSVNLSRSHTFCPSIYKCFELCLSGYFRCPVFIGQVFNRVHQDLSVMDMLASNGTKVWNLLINLGITKAFLIVPTCFWIFYLISIWSPCTYAKSSNGFLNIGDRIILDFLLAPGTWFGDQKLVPDSFCWAAYGCHGWRVLHSKPTSSMTIRIFEEGLASTIWLGIWAYVESWNQNRLILCFALQKFCNSLLAHAFSPCSSVSGGGGCWVQRELYRLGIAHRQLGGAWWRKYVVFRREPWTLLPHSSIHSRFTWLLDRSSLDVICYACLFHGMASLGHWESQSPRQVGNSSWPMTDDTQLFYARIDEALRIVLSMFHWNCLRNCLIFKINTLRWPCCCIHLLVKRSF